MLKLKKNGHFEVFLGVVVRFPMIFSRSVCNLHSICKNWLELRPTCFFKKQSVLLKLSLTMVFRWFWPFLSLFLIISGVGEDVAHIKIGRNDKRVISNCLLNWFCYALWSKSGGRSASHFQDFIFYLNEVNEPASLYFDGNFAQIIGALYVTVSRP